MSVDKCIKNSEALLAKGFINGEALQDIEAVVVRFSVSISRGILENTRSKAVLAQYVPSVDELAIKEDELNDPIGDEIHTPIKGITHRYPDRVLLKAVHVCEVYCRFCFRREKVGRGKDILNNEEIDAALLYIKEQPEIFEVILSGGDPLVIHPEKLSYIINQLNSIDHVQVIRIHTRLPLASPHKIRPDLLDALYSEKAVFMVVHCNSHEEINADVKAAFKRILSCGIPLLSQSVLLKGINDSAESLEKLFRALVANRVKPYYLHHPDKAEGTSHFRVPLKKGIELTADLRGRISGLCQPGYVLDIPGGFGKVPIGQSYLQKDDEHYKIEDWQGNFHNYKD